MEPHLKIEKHFLNLSAEEISPIVADRLATSRLL